MGNAESTGAAAPSDVVRVCVVRDGKRASRTNSLVLSSLPEFAVVSANVAAAAIAMRASASARFTLDVSLLAKGDALRATRRPAYRNCAAIPRARAAGMLDTIAREAAKLGDVYAAADRIISATAGAHSAYSTALALDVDLSTGEEGRPARANVTRAIGREIDAFVASTIYGKRVPDCGIHIPDAGAGTLDVYDTIVAEINAMAHSAKTPGRGTKRRAPVGSSMGRVTGRVRLPGPRKRPLGRAPDAADTSKRAAV